MNKKFLYIIIVQIILSAAALYGQNYKAEYKKLSSPLFKEESPVICILEKDTTLFASLAKYPEFTNKFTCYSSDVIAGLKDVLQVEAFNPDDQKFQQALKDQLSVGYILDWQSMPGSDDSFQLEIYSTESGQKIYSNKFYPSINSTPFNDVKMLLVDSNEPVYNAPEGEISINVLPETAHNKLLAGDEVVKEWTGNINDRVPAGKYRIISEADKYNSRDSEIDVVEGKTTSLNIELKPEYSSFITVTSLDKNISNIRSDVNENQVKITYDLLSKDKSDILVKVINKQTGTSSTPKMLTGDIEGVKPGNNKIIFWEILKEIGTMPVNDIQIQLSAEEKGGIPWYYYAGGGAALLGGAAVLLMGGGGGNDTGNNPPAAKIGTPPGRP